MNNTSAKWSVAENYLYLSFDLIRDDRFLTGSENVRHPINNQSDAKRDAFSRASNCLLVIIPGTYRLIVILKYFAVFSLAVEIENLRFGLNTLYDEPLSQK